MKKNVNKGFKKRKILKKNVASTSTTKKPTTTPECNVSNYCSLPDLAAQVASKEKTKKTIQARIDSNQYEAAIKSAQAVIDGINANIENNNNAITQKQESIKSLEAGKKTCIRLPTNPQILKCRKEIDNDIMKINNEIAKLESNNKKLAEKLPKAQSDLAFAQNRQQKDQDEIVSCQKTIDKINERINAIKKSCKGRAPNCP